MYRFIRSFLFLFPPEWVHYFSMGCLKFFCSIGFCRKIIHKKFTPDNTGLSKNVFNLEFKNPVGLGAGFDKNAKYLKELELLGFGFVEIGTVTPLPQPGNPKPRLFRLPPDKALINRMGFNNDGVAVVAKRLREWSMSNRQLAIGNVQPLIDGNNNPVEFRSRLIIGGNIGKNKTTANEDAWKDYEKCFRELFDCVDYFVVNVSSPNTPGLRELQEKESLKKILSNLQVINRSKNKLKPILLKIAPDLSKEQIDDVIDLADEIKLDGLVVSNTTISRSGLLTPHSKLEAIGQGGLSGLPLKKRSTEIVEYIHQKLAISIIASGGIFTSVDAKEKFTAGASLVQVWTGFIYEGPGIVKNICKDLNPLPIT